MQKYLSYLMTIVIVASLSLLLCFSFTPIASASTPDSDPQQTQTADQLPGWLELPAYEEGEEGRFVVTHTAQMGGRLQRNYTLLYDEETFTALWVAYPLCSAHISTGRKEKWGYDPHIPSELQTSVSRGYGASQPTPNYPKNYYARGHQIPNADRNAVSQMQDQTYFSSNMTPQIQNGFNSGIWKNLEAAVRHEIPAGDTLYVVTGACFQRVGEDEPVKMIVNKNDSKPLPIPNYYWKALMKVKRSEGEIVSAQTIAFWLPHEELKGHSYTEYVVSVDQLEQWLGLDFFPNLPDSIEVSAESNMSWITF